MRKVTSILIVLFLASPTMATVIINCLDIGSGVAELSYDSTGESLPVIAFGLDITVSQGVILSTDNWSDVYWVYPGSIIIDPNGIGENGSPVADPEDHPEDTLPGLGTYGITLEMGALYGGEDPPPPPTGVLLTFTVSQECDVSISENNIRGGVILEGGIPTDIYAPPCHMTPEPTTISLLSLGAIVLLKKRST